MEACVQQHTMAQQQAKQVFSTQANSQYKFVQITIIEILSTEPVNTLRTRLRV